MIIRADAYSNPELYEGRAYVYLGSAAGLGRITKIIYESNSNDSLLGYSVSAAGDVNGDSLGDVIVGEPNAKKNYGKYLGAAFTWYGR